MSDSHPTKREFREMCEVSLLSGLFKAGGREVAGTPHFEDLNAIAPRGKNAVFVDPQGDEWATVLCTPQKSNSGKSITQWLIAYKRAKDGALVANFGRPYVWRCARENLDY